MLSLMAALSKTFIYFPQISTPLGDEFFRSHIVPSVNELWVLFVTVLC